MTPSEDWRSIPGWEDLYEASSLGRVRSLGRFVRHWRGGMAWRDGRILRPARRSANQYLAVTLYRDGQKATASVHQLVALAFIGPQAAGVQVRHLNGVPTDNRIENLRYGSASDNMLDKVRHGTHHLANVTHCPSGHPYDEANTYRYTSPSTGSTMRYCRTCLRKKEQARRASRATSTVST